MSVIDLRYLKCLVAAIEYTGDDIALNQALCEIDIEIYRLLTECFPRRVKPVVAAGPQRLAVDWDSILSDISGQMECQGESNIDSISVTSQRNASDGESS